MVDVIVQAAQLASDHPRVRDLDLNPVIASSDGIVVTDAVIRLADEDADGDSLIRKLVVKPALLRPQRSLPWRHGVAR